MRGRSFILIVVAVVAAAGFLVPCYSQQAQQTTNREEIVLTTYYPTPFGDYREMRAERMAVGRNWRTYANVCWEQGKCTDWVNEEGTGGDTDLIVEGNVGIGTTSPASKLTVSGVVETTSGGIKFPDGTIQLTAAKFPWNPDFDSGWFMMNAQRGIDSFKEVFHNLGVYPSFVKVLSRAIDGGNKGYIFEAMGSAQNDDDGEWTSYGGVIFAYNDKSVRLWVPTVGNNYANGRVICLPEGWADVNSQDSLSAEVRVLIWK